MVASALVQEVIYTGHLLENLGFPQKEPTMIYEDNHTCIAWSEGSVGGSDRAKQIDPESILCMTLLRLRFSD